MLRADVGSNHGVIPMHDQLDGVEQSVRVNGRGLADLVMGGPFLQFRFKSLELFFRIDFCLRIRALQQHFDELHRHVIKFSHQPGVALRVNQVLGGLLILRLIVGSNPLAKFPVFLFPDFSLLKPFLESSSFCLRERRQDHQDEKKEKTKSFHGITPAEQFHNQYFQTRHGYCSGLSGKSPNPSSGRRPTHYNGFRPKKTKHWLRSRIGIWLLDGKEPCFTLSVSGNLRQLSEVWRRFLSKNGVNSTHQKPHMTCLEPILNLYHLVVH